MAGRPRIDHGTAPSAGRHVARAAEVRDIGGVRHRITWLGVIPVALAIGACDLKPAPKKKPQAAATAPAAAAATAPVVPPAPRPAAITAVAPASADADVRAEACLQVGVRVADIMIASATDAVLKAQYEQARTDVVRATANSCTNGQWDAALRQCFLNARTQPEVDACKGRVRAPGTPGAPGGPAIVPAAPMPIQ
jgi:hypothetical protein